jgi:hypothetical protein
MNFDTVDELYLKHGQYRNGKIFFQFANNNTAAEARQWLVQRGVFPSVDGNQLVLGQHSSQLFLTRIDNTAPSRRRDSVMQRDNYQCQRCGFAAEDGRPLEAAHIVASADGGSDHPDNLTTLCIGCHSAADGWEISDFRGARRVERVVNYVSEVEDHDGHSLVLRAAELLGVTPEECRRLMDERLTEHEAVSDV